MKTTQIAGHTFKLTRGIRGRKVYQSLSQDIRLAQGEMSVETVPSWYFQSGQYDSRNVMAYRARASFYPTAEEALAAALSHRPTA